ncbi:MAG: hypothetical protein ACYTEQ_23725 [Planctomycetota bacterium]
MVSNSLSPRRKYLKRPIVCKASPVDAEPADFQCECLLHFDDETEFFVGDEYGAFVEVCSEEYAEEVEAVLTVTPPELEHVIQNEPFNCTGDAEFDFTVPEDPGFFNVGYIITFPEGETCSGSQTLEAIE